MPYFFVDGYRDNKPAPALYVKADKAEGAMARAAQLGMEGTGVRPAKEATAIEPAKSWTILLPILLLVVMAFLEKLGFQARGKAYPDMLPVQLLLMGLVTFSVYVTVLRQHRQQQQLEAELQELRLAVAQLQLTPR